ncbi:MAG: phage portal protein, partial [Phycisphaerales bacterium]|nr:phage portal protein [Phycisphaerales bacterium]
INQLRAATGAPLLETNGDVVDFREAALGDIIDRREYQYDDPSFGDSRFVLFTSLDDRKDGSFRPVYETEMDLAQIRGSARNLVKLTGVRTGALDALTNYVLGPGFTFKAASPDGMKTEPELLKSVQHFIDETLDENEFTGDMDREIHLRSREDGESPVALELRPGGKGKVKLLVIEPDQIVQPHNARALDDWLDLTEQFPSCWKFGVHTREGRTDEHLGYHIVYDGAGRDWDYIPVSRMQFVKRNTTRNAKRGVSDFFEVVTDLTREAKLCRNMVTGASLQAAVAWILKPPTGSTQAQVQSLADANAIYKYSKPGVSGSTTTQYVKKYQDGTILHTSPGGEYADMPGHERNAGFQIVGQYALRRIGTRWNMPEYLISGDASNANYSSTMVAESPFVKAREADQAFYRRHFLSIVW